MWQDIALMWFNRFFVIMPIKQFLLAFLLWVLFSVANHLACCCRKFGYVDFGTEEELQQALGLNGKRFMGQPIKLDRARSKEDSQESKKGNVCLLINSIIRREYFFYFYFFTDLVAHFIKSALLYAALG